MLVSLSIRDIVVIDSLSIDFTGGLTVLTGETGAGKSILLDSLSLALGSRGDATLVRTGAAQGDVSAVFEVDEDHPARALLAERDVPAEGALILRRVQSADGRSRAYINDEPVSVGLLRQLGSQLVEIHGQHDDRAMTEPATHRALLDAFGGLQDQAAGVAGACRQWRELNDRLSALEAETATARADAEYIRAAVEELTALSPQPGEEARLADTRQRMMQAEELTGDLTEAHDVVAGASSVMPALASVIRRLERKAADAGGALDAPVRTLDAALTALQESEAVLGASLEELRLDPAELERSEERLFALRAAGRKHGVPVDELTALADRMASELAAIDSGEERLEDLRRETGAAMEAYRRAARGLSKRRAAAGKMLGKAVDAELPDLKLERARFVVTVEPEPDRVAEAGIDSVAFLVQTNPGHNPGPMMKVASGGELARFLLALKVALADRGSAPTLVFDEIDTAVGGAVADAIGARLARLAEGVQVMSVTHAPQVAARAGAHLLVEKRPTAHGKSVSTGATALDDAARREEIARMLAGATVTDEARAAAERLIRGAA